jgi:hypothetical protein
MYAWMHAWMHVCMYACMYACMHACMYVFLYIIYIYNIIHIYIYEYLRVCVCYVVFHIKKRPCPFPGTDHHVGRRLLQHGQGPGPLAALLLGRLNKKKVGLIGVNGDE